MYYYKYLQLLFIAVLISSCGRDSRDHDHAHEEVDNLQIIEYSDDLELFAEVSPLVKDAKSTLLVHLTKLKDFKPLSNGKVSATLVVGKKGIRQVSEAPVRNGIWKLEIQPPVSGKAFLVFEIETEQGVVKITSKNQYVYDDEHDLNHSVNEHQEPANSIAFTKEMSWKTNFSTGYPALKQMGDLYHTSAKVLPAVNDEIVLSSKTAGYIKYGRNLVEGCAIGKDEVLFNLDGKGMVNDAPWVNYENAKNDFLLAKSNYERHLELADQMLISQKVLLESQNVFEKAKVQWENIQATISSAGVLVKSPFAGAVQSIYVNNGEYVEAGTPLLKIHKQNRMVLKCGIPLAKKSMVDGFANMSLEYAPNRYHDFKQLNGVVLAQGNHLEPNSNLLPLAVEVDVWEGSTINSLVEVTLEAKSSQEEIVIPVSGVVEEYGSYYVFVQVTPELFEKREVIVGQNNGMEVVVKSGISTLERIVTNGAIKVKLAAVSNSVDPHAGHVH